MLAVLNASATEAKDMYAYVPNRQQPDNLAALHETTLWPGVAGCE